ncbi:MAG: L-lysine 6-transaminase [Bacteroidetes bacterium]|nr:L-lysine 6-transaminase [Bacteroidota bacterium]MCL5738896.1 L-lysine 6-transaminase [Bacteroidota bacterium]
MTFNEVKQKKEHPVSTGDIAYSQNIGPEQVMDVLRKHMLVDGFDIVFDLKRSKGSYVFDSKRKKYYLDFFTFFASSPVGFNHPKMTTPEFMEKLAYVSLSKPSSSDSYTVEMAEFVDTFSRIAIPDYLPHAFFIEGGALAVENALKAAFDYRMQKNLRSGFYRSEDDESRLKVIHFRRAFHGRTGYTLSLTNTDPIKTKYYPKFNWPRIHNPAIRFPLNDENLRFIKQEEEIAINQIKQAIVEFGKDIAALIVEPIQAEGGDKHFRKEFFVRLRELCSENDIIMIMDEVQTGVGLTGKMWAHQHYVQPDAISFGKKAQVCGVLAGNKFNEVKENVFNTPGRINSTWGGNLTDMVRFTKYLQIIEEEKLIDNTVKVGEHLLTRLREVESEFPHLVLNSRGLGLFCAFDMPSPEKRLELRQHVFDKNLLLIGCGERTIRFRPPLNLNKAEVEEGIEIIKKSLAEMSVD